MNLAINFTKFTQVHKFAYFNDLHGDKNCLRDNKKHQKRLFEGIFKILIGLQPFKILREQLFFM